MLRIRIKRHGTGIDCNGLESKGSEVAMGRRASRVLRDDMIPNIHNLLDRALTHKIFLHNQKLEEKAEIVICFEVLIS